MILKTSENKLYLLLKVSPLNNKISSAYYLYEQKPFYTHSKKLTSKLLKE